MILKKAKNYLTILSALAVLISVSSCKQESKLKTVPIPGLADTVQHEKAPPAKITATKADLCRIVMVQKRLVNENSTYDDHTNDVIVTLLSDGSGERIIANRDSIFKSLETFYYDSICNFQKNLIISRNLDKMIFMVGYCDSRGRLLSDNFVKYDLLTKKSELLISGTDYEYSIFDNPPRKPTRQHVSEYDFFQKEDILFVDKEFSFWTINCKNGLKAKYQRGLTLFNILPISGSECYANFHYPTDTALIKPHVGKFNIETQKMDALPAEMDSFMISPYTISEDANSILIYHATPFTASDHDLFLDTVFVLNHSFKKQKQFIVNEKVETFSGLPDPKGKWLYFETNNSIYRFRLSEVSDGMTYSIQDFISKSQLIYQAPTKNEITYEIKSFSLTSVTE